MMGTSDHSTVVPAKTTIGPLKKLLVEGAHAWGLPELLVLAMMSLPFIAAATSGVIILIDKEFYRWLTGSKGLALTEVFPILFWYFNLILGFVVARRLWRHGDKLLALLYVGLSVSFAIIIGDKTAWGQTIFGFGGRVVYAAGITGKFTRLDTINVVEELSRWGQLLVGAYGTIVPLVMLRWKTPSQLNKRLSRLVPHFTLIPYFFTMFAWRLYRNFFTPPQEYYFLITQYNEVMELLLSMGFTLFLIFQLRELEKNRDHWLPA